ncbi:MAG TPA: HAMP domain-containing sensor histidine kinase [Ferruginibacter sp.]|nr:HAMP domain-containing sensor histidine kinase [Ferruginibacter sp.]HRO97135.1 HAMP domain-containing sensor histidine kinase [Ferruginibacter sp.]HRP50455.1 HAMP domain-containing sensor histidine kinase [Ferruginibacter sp.]
MLFPFFNWRALLTLAAIVIVTLSIFFSQYLSRKIAREEKVKIEQWVEALKDINNPDITDTRLASQILMENSKDIPMIAVTEKGVLLDHRNIDSLRAEQDPKYVDEKLREFKSQNDPVVWRNPHNTDENNLVYYGESRLLKQIRYFPIVQLVVLAMFLTVVVIAISTRNKSTQNQVWAGMAKETAHQLGTPLSSLQGWVEILKESPGNEKIAAEMSKDVDRLKLVSERFGKIGSTPQLEESDILRQIHQMVQYLKRRAPEKVEFDVKSSLSEVMVMVNPPLFDWVMENLLKNALDAMESTGSISIQVIQEPAKVIVDVTDTGKGILKKNIPMVFKPGFSTKKRGWGLGLSLSKRIIEQYHRGVLMVKHSEPGKGTTFRIELPR